MEYSMALGELTQEMERRGERVVFSVPSARADTVQLALDEIGALMAAVNA
jgi:hypothetical protein